MAICIACSACSGSPSSGSAQPAAPAASLGFSAAELPSARARGQALFLEHCALCHGANADGHGVRASGFEKPPADLHRAEYRDAARVLHAVRDGVQGSPMAGWKQSLGELELRELSAYVVHLEEN